MLKERDSIEKEKELRIEKEIIELLDKNECDIIQGCCILSNLILDVSVITDMLYFSSGISNLLNSFKAFNLKSRSHWGSLRYLDKSLTMFSSIVYVISITNLYHLD